jgi:prepilin-type N-terminal cleavage/methylation domain-containing protein
MKKQNGFTLIEVLAVVSIIAVLAVGAAISVSGQTAKARDSKRKADLNRIQNLFEQYYDDNRRYPPAADVSNSASGNTGVVCGKSLLPYTGSLPCDPKKGYSYMYDVDGAGKYYKIYAKFEYTADPEVKHLGCGGGCGPGTSHSYNYWVASNNVPIVP